MGKVLIKIGKVVEIEDEFSAGVADGLRIRAAIDEDLDLHGNVKSNVPWAFPLLPKAIRTAPKIGEGVLIIADAIDEFGSGQRYYIGPIISQPQFNVKCPVSLSTSLIRSARDTKPLPSILNNGDVNGAFPESGDVAIVGRGGEDIILRDGGENGTTSTINLRAGIRGWASSDDPYKDGMLGNIIFNGADPAYIQLKYKKGITTGKETYANSLVNIVADRINIMSNLDNNINDGLGDKKEYIKEEQIDSMMKNLHQVPHGDKLVKLLELMWQAILNHVHDYPGNPQKGDNVGAINQIEKEFPNFRSILSEYVRIS